MYQVETNTDIFIAKLPAKDLDLKVLKEICISVIPSEDSLICEFPPGWDGIGDENHFIIIDGMGQKRLLVKRPTGQRAQTYLMCRYSISFIPKKKGSQLWKSTVKDMGTLIVYETPQDKFNEKREHWTDFQNRLGSICVRHLNNKYPDWTNPLKYWETA